MYICDPDLCTGCSACYAACPVDAISMIESENGFLYPKIDAKKCIGCQKCQITCPNNRTPETFPASFYMGWNKNLEVVKASSSGGAFSALANWVLSQNGIVYGASYNNETGIVSHVSIKRKEELGKIRLSKYYQSQIDNIYADIKQELKTKLVLFSGTGCQIAGLLSYLGKKYDNLLTVDVLCHGVASKKIVDSYISCLEKKFHKKVLDYRFRVKENDSFWGKGQSTRMALTFEDGTKRINNALLDTYFLGFNQFLFLRESCYHCKYVGTNRLADFTLADYWGIPSEQLDQSHYQYGVSLILANSPKAKSILPALSDELYYSPIDPEIAVAHNQAFSSPSTFNKHREYFLSNLREDNFNKLIYRIYWKYFVKQYMKLTVQYLLGENNFKRIKRLKQKITKK